jgi:hypothetical protein
MTIQRMDNVLIVVEDLEAAKAFFTELGGDPDVSRRRAPDQVRDQALSVRRRIGARSGHPRISWRCVPRRS